MIGMDHGNNQFEFIKLMLQLRILYQRQGFYISVRPVMSMDNHMTTNPKIHPSLKCEG